jgi:hypothetical protein
MHKTYLISTDSLKTIAQGALGAMSFGAYHQYTTNKIMELNNEKQELKTQYLLDNIEKKYNKQIYELREKISRLEK